MQPTDDVKPAAEPDPSDPGGSPEGGDGSELPPPPDPPVRRKSAGKGCMVISLVVLGLGVLAAGGLGVMCYAVFQDPEIEEVVAALGSIFDSPGRKALLAAGCDRAMVIDMRAFAEIAKKQPDANPEEIAKLEGAVFVNCVFAADEPALTCAAVAAAYRQAVPDGPPRVSVFVKTADNTEPACSGLYGAAGEYLGEAPAPPGGPRAAQ